jgi:phosphate transport system substrate-binding protein
MRWLILVLAVVTCFSCVRDDTSIKIKGSDTEVNLAVRLAEAFHNENSQILISISGGGSGLGIVSLLNGTADIANTSRSINADELVLFKEKSIQLDSFPFAQDAIAFVVSENLLLDSMNTSDLAKVFSGDYSNWNSLTKKDLPINIYGRQGNSGTHDFVKDVLNIRFSPYARQMNGNAQILEAIKADDSGIGYVGAGYVMDGSVKGIKILKIYKGNGRAVSPLDAEKIASGGYLFQRPLFQYYKTEDYPRLKRFLDFEKSEVALKIIRSSGYYAIN